MASYASPPSSSAHGTPLVRKLDASGKAASDNVLLDNFGDEERCPIDSSLDAEIHLHTKNVQSAQAVLRELNRCQCNFASADALFAELLAVVEENIHNIAEKPNQAGGIDHPSGSCRGQLFHPQEQRNRIDALEAECAELLAKNKFLEDLNEALTMQIATLQNRTLELTPSTPSMSKRSSASELTARATVGDPYARSADSTICLSPRSASSTQFLTPDVIREGYESFESFESFPDGPNVGTFEPRLPSHPVFSGISPTSSFFGDDGSAVVIPRSATIYLDADPAMLEIGDQLPPSQAVAVSESGTHCQNLGVITTPRSSKIFLQSNTRSCFDPALSESQHAGDRRGLRRRPAEERSGADSQATDASRTSTALDEFVEASTTNPSSRTQSRSQTQFTTEDPGESDINKDGDAVHSADQPRQPRERTHAELKESIMASYQYFGLGIELIFSYMPDSFHPRTINMRSSSKNKSLLTPVVMKILKREAMDIVAFLPNDPNHRLIEQDTTVLQKTLYGVDYPAIRNSLQTLVTSLHLKSKSSRDEARLAKFECYSILAVLRLQDRLQYERTSQELDSYQVDLLEAYHCLHCVLDGLEMAWEGYHMILLFYLLRAGVGRLLKYFATAKRPAAIALLVKMMNTDESMSAKHAVVHDIARRLKEQTVHGSSCSPQTPLERIIFHVDGLIDGETVQRALFYSTAYNSADDETPIQRSRLEHLRPLAGKRMRSNDDNGSVTNKRLRI